MLAELWLAIAPAQDGTVQIVRKDDVYELTLVSISGDAAADYAKMTAAIATLCGSAGVQRKSPLMVGTTDKKPQRPQIMQLVQCNPAPASPQ